MLHNGVWSLRLAALAAALLAGTAAPAWAQHGHGGGGGGHGGGHGGGFSGGHGGGMHGGGMHGGGFHGGGFHGGGFHHGYGYGLGFGYYPGFYGGYDGGGGVYLDLTPGYGYPGVALGDYSPPIRYYYDPPAYPQPAVNPPSGGDNSATVEVVVPANAQVWFDGEPTKQGGERRLFSSPPLDPEKVYHYEVRARWTEGERVVDQTRRVEVRGGKRTGVDFTKPQ